jgi:hypothetical protein
VSTEREIPINFSSFIVSLASSAMVNLGEVPDPITKERNLNLALARQTIDLIGVLEEKTRGNLDEEEKKLLESVLYDLRMRFVQHSKQEESGEEAEPSTE